jgi:maltose O-acetyltransferase
MQHRSFLQKVFHRLGAIWLELVTGYLWWFVGYIPLHHFRRLSYRLAGMTIGSGSTIHMMARIYDPRHIQIGRDTIVGEKATLDGRRQLAGSKGELTIGDHVDIASEVMIWTSQHDLKDPRFGAIEEPVVIEDYVFVGPRAIILPGVTLGRGSVAAAGAVVTKSVAPLSIVAGIPAKEIGTRAPDSLGYRLGRARWFQ